MKKQSNKNSFAKYKEALHFVDNISTYSTHKKIRVAKNSPDFFLARRKYYLKLVGSPEKYFKYIHITGTAGKGSVSNMVHNVLVCAGKKSGLFTSPYVTSAIEKIKVGELYISQDEFVTIVDGLKPMVIKASKSKFGAPSHFELFLIIALIYFKNKKCEYVVLEVGIGGKFDVTNIMPRSTSAVTNVDYDHTKILGKTLREIAEDKAGVIKEKGLFFTTEQRPALKKIFQRVCDEKKATPYFIEKQKTYLDYNRILVEKIAQSLGIEDMYIKEGIAKSKMPCRFEIVSTSPLVVLDGAHNRAKIKSTIANLKNFKFDKLTILITATKSLDEKKAVLEYLVPLADNIILTSLKSSERKSSHPNQFLPHIQSQMKKGAEVRVVMDHNEALDQALSLSKKNDCVLVTGSFFLAGEIRKNWYSEEWILENRKSYKD